MTDAPPDDELVAAPVDDGWERVDGPSARDLILGSGPRFAGEGFGPIAAFYIGWKLVGLALGIVMATAVGVAAYRFARRSERSGNMAKLALGFVLIQALVGLASNSAIVYLGQSVLTSGILGLVFLGSVVLGRPLAGVFAQDAFAFPDEVKASRTFRRTFGTVSLVWGTYLVTRAVLRMVILASSSIDFYVGINVATGPPMMAVLMTWSLWYGRRGFLRSEEWGWAFDHPLDPGGEPTLAPEPG